MNGKSNIRVHLKNVAVLGGTNKKLASNTILVAVLWFFYLSNVHAGSHYFPTQDSAYEACHTDANRLMDARSSSFHSYSCLPGGAGKYRLWHYQNSMWVPDEVLDEYYYPTGNNMPSKHAGYSCSSPYAGNPILISVGNKYQHEPDYQRVSGLSIERSYNSERYQPIDYGFGLGWSSPIFRSLSRNNDTMTILRSTGYAEIQTKIDGVWVGDLDSKYVIKETLTGYTLTYGRGNTEYYNLTGRIVSDIDIQGHITTYGYTDVYGKLSDITDYFGQKITIDYDSSGHIDIITTPDNGTLTYAYDAINNLISVTNQDNKTRQYHYENSSFTHALTGITDENGNRYATWTYDDQGRAISSEHAGGVDKHTLAFNADGTTTVTNPLGKQTTYHFTDILGVKKVTQVEGHPTASCAGANKAYTYDANGFLTSKTDWQGHLTTYTRDNRGLELSRTEAAGTPEARTITTEWHTDYRLPVRITEPGKITEFTYDVQGRELSRKIKSY